MDYLNTEENKSRKEALRNNYQSLSEVTQLLLKQVDQLSQAFKAMNLPDKTDETKQLLEKRISEALDICDILRSAADLCKSPNEMIGYYLLGAKQQAKDFNVRASESVKVVNDHLLLEVGHSENSEMAELSLEARLYAENQREEIANQVSLVEGNIKIRKKN